jgi:hypothetical protein
MGVGVEDRAGVSPFVRQSATRYGLYGHSKTVPCQGIRGIDISHRLGFQGFEWDNGYREKLHDHTISIGKLKSF